MGKNRIVVYLICALACVYAATLAPAQAVTAASARAAERTVTTELRALRAAGAIDQATYDSHAQTYRDLRRRIRRYSGARTLQLDGLRKTLEGIAARGQLTAQRLTPLMLTVERNVEYFSEKRPPAAGSRISFEGSELIWQYVPGQGLQIHPLANFGRLNAYAKGSRRNDDRTALLLDELLEIAVPRAGGLAWEYYFTFNGGAPPWVSSLAQGTGLQAIARAGVRLDRSDELRGVIQGGLKLFQAPPPTGLRAQGADGIHYAQYSYAPNLVILNGFIQSLIGLYDVAQITGDPLAAQLFAEGDATARASMGSFDTGAWSYYSRGSITRESDLHYHTLLREFLVGLCKRTQASEYCQAEANFGAYLKIPPALELITTRVRGATPSEIRFELSKISYATVTISAPSGRRVARIATGRIGLGERSVRFTAPRRPGIYSVAIDATDLAGNRARTDGEIEVLKPRRSRRG